MAEAMESFIAVQNIVNFKVQLQRETRPDQRRILMRLLATEVARHPEAVQHAQAIIAQRTADVSFG